MFDPMGMASYQFLYGSTGKEQLKKAGCLRVYILRNILRSYIGNTISQHKDSYLATSIVESKAGSFSWLKC